MEGTPRDHATMFVYGCHIVDNLSTLQGELGCTFTTLQHL